jgi:hypothetical protein
MVHQYFFFKKTKDNALTKADTRWQPKVLKSTYQTGTVNKLNQAHYFLEKKQAAAKLFKIWHLQGTVSVSSMPNG